MKFSKLLKRASSLALAVVLILSLAVPAFAASTRTDPTTTVNLMAAASTRYSLGERQADGTYPAGTLLHDFESLHSDITVNVTYDSSGNLLNQMIADQTRSADVFLSADLQRMQAGVTDGIIDNGTVYNLLNNQLVLIANKNAGPTLNDLSSYSGVLGWLQNNSGKKIAIGDPAVVPAGTYTQQVFNTIDPTGATWNTINTTNYSVKYSNVTNVLNAVVTNVNPIGSVYATDAKTQSTNLNVLDSRDVNIIYPIGITTAATLAGGERGSAAQSLVNFLEADIANTSGIFQSFGFSPAQ